ncbi:MAG: DHHA1 domain-containing protein [Candidatus Micrarchaeota archaeon]
MEPQLPQPSPQKAFERHCASLGKAVLDYTSVLAVHHYDADGIAAASISALALKSKGVAFDLLCAQSLGEDEIRTAARSNASALLFFDLGAGRLSQLNSLARLGKPVFVFDHHQSAKVEQPSPSLSVAIPQQFGFDGAREACASTASFFAFSPHVPISAAARMSALALAGACGDLQDRGGLAGANLAVLDSARRLNAVSCARGLRLYGTGLQPLPSMLAHSFDQYLPGISGSQKAASIFLRRNSIPFSQARDGKKVFLRFCDLSNVDQARLVGALALHCAERKVPAASMRALVGEVLALSSPDWLGGSASTAGELATLLNACGRQGCGGAAVSLCLGEKSALEEALAALASHRTVLGRGMWLARNRLEDFGGFCFLDARGELPAASAGTIAGLLLQSGEAAQAKPVVVACLDDAGLSKVSARAGQGCKSDVGAAFSCAAAQAGGEGGGHAHAAAAKFHSGDEKLAQFLLAFNSALKTH